MFTVDGGIGDQFGRLAPCLMLSTVIRRKGEFLNLLAKWFRKPEIKPVDEQAAYDTEIQFRQAEHHWETNYAYVCKRSNGCNYEEWED